MIAIERTVDGVPATDSFGLKYQGIPVSSKVNGMDFFLIKNIEAAEENLITDSTQVNGIIGMSREDLTTSNYIDLLFEQNLIPSRKFSLLLGDVYSYSSLTLGDSNQSYVHSDFEYAEFPVSTLVNDVWAIEI